MHRAAAGGQPVIPPYGGTLVSPTAPIEQRDDLLARAKALPSIQVSDRAACDLEMLAVGGFSPLVSFMGRSDYQRVVHEMRLTDGTLFPIPVTLTIPNGTTVPLDGDVALRDAHNRVLAVLGVEEVYDWNYAEACQSIAATTDPRHPLVAEMASWGSRNIAGRLQVLALPEHHDFVELRLTPADTRLALAARGASKVVAFQTRNPLHRAHEELTKRAVDALDDALLLLHPVVGLTKPGDVDHYTRVRTYKILVDRYYERHRVVLALLPLAMRMAGPREALWHTLIRRNYGASHFIVGRDHASPGQDSRGEPFYAPYSAQELVERFSDEHGVQMVPFEELVYLPDEHRYELSSRVAPGTRTAVISGSDVRRVYLNEGCRLPDWFTRPEVAEILEGAYPPRDRQGVCVWFTGLSGAGKSAAADALTSMLLEHGRQVTVLDGDVVRTHLSAGLGFSKPDRDANILRIGFVASEVVRHGGIAICAAVSPYRSTRDRVRELVGSDQFIEVFVDTPLAVCEARDTKGMYAKARRGEITAFTGIDDPYETPLRPELTLDTETASVRDNARRVFDLLVERRFFRTLSVSQEG
jgi:sulfate adenylyltransferase